MLGCKGKFRIKNFGLMFSGGSRGIKRIEQRFVWLFMGEKMTYNLKVVPTTIPPTIERLSWVRREVNWIEEMEGLDFDNSGREGKYK